jgi:hypothetical protein
VKRFVKTDMALPCVEVKSPKNREFESMPPMTSIARNAALAGLVGLMAPLQPAMAAPPPPPPPPSVTYADLADLADSAPIVLRAEVRKVVQVEPARAQGVRPGWARFYVEARTKALLTGGAPVGEALTYLVDMPLDARGKPTAIKKKLVILLARPVRGRPGAIQLVTPDAQVLWDAGIEAQLRSILTALIAPDAPGRITGVREAIHVPGNLQGEGETQIFLQTGDQSAASITVLRRPNASSVWGASFSEVMAKTGDVPARDTLPWYRLACFLPAGLPPGSNLSETATARAAAEADYRQVRGELGACPRQRR